MRPIRVLHVYRTFDPALPGGVQEAIAQIARATSELGVENSVFCLSPEPRPERMVVGSADVRRARSWAAPASCNLGSARAWRLFSEMAKANDVIHYHFPWPFADLLHLTVRPEAPALMTYHSDIVRQSVLEKPYRPLMWAMLDRMKAVIATSPPYVDTSPVLSDRRLAGRVRVIPLGLEDLREAERSAAPAEPPYILFVGALRYYKGLDFLLQAASAVEARIVIAGEGPEGARLRRRAGELRLSNVEFLGQVSEPRKRALLAGCRALVLPSHLRSEAFGVVLAEAARQGRPMVTCDVGSGTSYVNLDRETGLVVPPQDPVALGNALNALIRDPALAVRYGKAARARYEALFSLDHLGRAHRAVYDEVLGEG